jgi:hypothetical protein
MGSLDFLKKINVKKVVDTVTKAASDIRDVSQAYQSGGVAGGLAAVGSLSKDSPLTPTTVYGSPGAATAAQAYNAAAGTGKAPGESMMPLVLGGLLILLLLLLSKRG